MKFLMLVSTLILSQLASAGNSRIVTVEEKQLAWQTLGDVLPTLVGDEGSISLCQVFDVASAGESDKLQIGCEYAAIRTNFKGYVRFDAIEVKNGKVVKAEFNSLSRSELYK
ncbi:MAG: hypothetical protein AB7O96_07220 [Pseudobdellovibrionaceae bacterium]